MLDGLATIANQLSKVSRAEWYSRHWQIINLAVAAPQFCWPGTVQRHVKSKPFTARMVTTTSL